MEKKTKLLIALNIFNLILNEFLFDWLYVLSNAKGKQGNFVLESPTTIILLNSSKFAQIKFGVCLFSCFGNFVAIKYDFRQNIAAKQNKGEQSLYKRRRWTMNALQNQIKLFCRMMIICMDIYWVLCIYTRKWWANGK